MEDPLVKKLSLHGPLSPEEENALAEAVSEQRDIGADEEFISEGSEPSYSILLLDGFAARFKYTADGKRQILSVHVKGDFVDLHSFLLQPMEHGVFSLSPCTLALAPHHRIREITESFPHLTRLLWHSTLIDGAIHREWILNLGCRSAVSRVAHFLCELFLRLRAVGETQGRSFRLPITQNEMADIAGMSIVHLNRSVQDLRARRLLSWRGQDVSIDNWDRLSALGDFDPNYLSLPERLIPSGD